MVLTLLASVNIFVLFLFNRAFSVKKICPINNNGFLFLKSARWQ